MVILMAFTMTNLHDGHCRVNNKLELQTGVEQHMKGGKKMK